MARAETLERAAIERGRSGSRPIELKVHRIGQLFHTLDPLPFHERDLDAAVEDYVVGWAREEGRPGPVRIIIHLPLAEAARPDAGQIGAAIRNYFAYRAQAARWELLELLRIGRASLLIGAAVLALCVGLETQIRRMGAGDVARFFDEGLIILGWVANWRPLQIFLYDWWPIAQRRRLLLRLAEADVEVRAHASEDGAEGEDGQRDSLDAPPTLRASNPSMPRVEI